MTGRLDSPKPAQFRDFARRQDCYCVSLRASLWDVVIFLCRCLDPAVFQNGSFSYFEALLQSCLLDHDQPASVSGGLYCVTGNAKVLSEIGRFSSRVLITSPSEKGTHQVANKELTHLTRTAAAF